MQAYQLHRLQYCQSTRLMLVAEVGCKEGQVLQQALGAQWEVEKELEKGG
jgi:hypothetical protein